MERKKIAVMTGTFDPVTVGHTDIIGRACGIFDEVVVCLFDNCEKDAMFSHRTRLEALEKAVAPFDNCRVTEGHGLAAEFAVSLGASAVIRGIRDPADAAYEAELAHINEAISGIETVILVSKPGYSFVSSTFVRELIRYGGDYKKYLPDGVFEILVK